MAEEIPIPQVSPEAARSALEAGMAIYLDVRTVPEFHAGHVPGAINIPVAEINPATGRMEENPQFLSLIQAHVPKDADLVVGCKSGGRSMAACELMANVGYKKVRNLDGGFGGVVDAKGQVIQEGWSTLGYPIERGEGGDRSYAALARHALPNPTNLPGKE